MLSMVVCQSVERQSAGLPVGTLILSVLASGMSELLVGIGSRVKVAVSPGTPTLEVSIAKDADCSSVIGTAELSEANAVLMSIEQDATVKVSVEFVEVAVAVVSGSDGVLTELGAKLETSTVAIDEVGGISSSMLVLVWVPGVAIVELTMR